MGDAKESSGEYNIIRICKITMEKPNRPLLQFNVAVVDPKKIIKIIGLTLSRDGDANNSYTLDFDGLEDNQKMAIINYLSERIDGDIASFIIDYSNIMDGRTYHRCLKDIQKYV